MSRSPVQARKTWWIANKFISLSRSINDVETTPRIGAVSCLVVVLAASCSAQSTSSSGSAPRSPCPNVFQYEPSGTEPGRWYGVVNLSTDNTLHSLWLNVVLDSKADILGNWVGDVSTTDNIDFKIENTKMKIHPGPAVAVRFFVQYNPLKTPIPRLQTIRLNGREICNANTPVPADSILDSTSSGQSRPESGRPVSTRPVERPVERPIASRPVSSRPADSRPSIRPEDTPVTRPVHGSPSSSGPVYVPTANPPIDQINVNPFVIGEGGKGQSGSRPNSVYGHTTSSYTTTTTENPDFEDFDTVK
ncbi:hypothetical protein RR46_00135 [Papilio xuthus]|uniref:Serine protease gd N-terminal domain-containing protein n=1 Tax=Papilio xuthus TaxID=66420 RepID=A0A0N1PK77_PAPXU|nr:hypothetical protein RR46_00135 [Papilio xuthus]